ncbi:hypothetical protein [Streptomyces sp. NPDC058989]|uniref:hypothetical protein n=1 Tax=Streptomyces sp. NPDC058989 TaxID=3346686 RepID=UPI0036A253C7
MEGKSLAERANVRYAIVGRGKRIHYSGNDDSLCGKEITEYLDIFDVVELLDHKGYDWCTPCGTRAEKRAKARDTDATTPTEESAEQAPPVAALATEPHVVEGVIVEHAGTAEGCAPRDVTHPDVVAAREALAGLAAATLTDHHDFSEPAEDERDVRGYVINPRGHGRVALYWLEGGMNVRRDVMPHGPALDCLADRMTRRGWSVEKMLRSSQCVFAHRPPAGAQPAAPAELPAGDDLDDTCLHGLRPRPDVSGDPITWCARKRPNQVAGVWNDEGCVLASDCCVDAANECAQFNVEAEAPAGDPEFSWALMCTEHEEQMLDSCEECHAVPAEDRCSECAGKGCHWCHWTGEQQPEQAVDEAEAVEQPAAGGTWRSGWIASAPSPVGDELFDLDQGEGEQGALFE